MYVWALRDKSSEWNALRQLAARGPLGFTPLVEAVCEPLLPRKDRVRIAPEDMIKGLSARAGEIAAWGRAWIDLGHLALLMPPAQIAHLLSVAQSNAGLFSANVTPVVRAGADAQIVNQAREWHTQHGSGVCIRVEGLTHIKDKSQQVSTLVRLLGLPLSDLDLVLNAQHLPRLLNLRELEGAFPESGSVRNWVKLAGTFPPKVSDYDLDTYEHRLDRDEWLTWEEEVQSGDLGRIPHYGDFATQSPLYEPSPEARGSITVRYTSSRHYVILRGRGGKNIDYSQFVGHARFLAKRPYYREVVATRGDEYVAKIATGAEGTGNLGTWRAASLVRHVEVAKSQVAAAVPTLVR